MMSKINGNHFEHEKCLTLDKLSSTIKNVQYAVRGKVVIRAAELEKELLNVIK